MINEFFHSQKTFPKKNFLDQGDFPQAGKISTVKEIFHKIFLLDQGNFPQSRKFSTKKFYLIKEIFHKQESLPNFFFFDQESFLQTKIFIQTKIFFANKDQKGSLKEKNLDLFNTKSYAKILLIL